MCTTVCTPYLVPTTRILLYYNPLRGLRSSNSPPWDVRGFYQYNHSEIHHIGWRLPVSKRVGKVHGRGKKVHLDQGWDIVSSDLAGEDLEACIHAHFIGDFPDKYLPRTDCQLFYFVWSSNCQLCSVSPSIEMSLLNSSFVPFVALALSFLATFSSAFNITKDLGPQLSPGATIIFPGSAEFLVATDRDNEQDPPVFAVVVEVATENDVIKTVSLCFWRTRTLGLPANRYNMPMPIRFLSWQRQVCMEEPTRWETCNRASISGWGSWILLPLPKMVAALHLVAEFLGLKWEMHYGPQASRQVIDTRQSIRTQKKAWHSLLSHWSLRMCLVGWARPRRWSRISPRLLWPYFW